jgi:signal transduction histidine kinase
MVLINDPAGRILGIDPDAARDERLTDLLAPDHPLCTLVEQLVTGSKKSLTTRLPQRPDAPTYMAIAHRIVETGKEGGILIELKEEAALAQLHTLVDHSKVLARLGQMAAGVAHEIRNPLQAINFELGALQHSTDLDAGEVEQHVRAATEEMQRLDRAISGFLKVARLRELRLSRTGINDLLEETHRAMEGEANLSGLDLDLQLDADVPHATCDREVLRQAIENLVKNAIQALPSREGRIVLESRVMNGEILISVADTGPGIPPDHIERATDLYFTTKESGTGVGLALVRQAIELHGGEIELDSKVGEGTVVTLKIPTGSEV